MYPATDDLPTDAKRADDGADGYGRKFRLENLTEVEPRHDAQLEVPEVRSAKWLVAVVVVMIAVSTALALATFAVSRGH